VATSKPSKQNPADVARETFRQLSISRTQPTPEAYRKVYNDIAGIEDESEKNENRQELETILLDFATSLALEDQEYAYFSRQLTTSAEQKKWREYQQGLSGFIEKLFSQIKNLQNKTPLVASP
jgi:diguanylate cyclase